MNPVRLPPVYCRQIFLSSLTLYNTSFLTRSYSWSSPHFSSTTIHNYPGICNLLSEVSYVYSTIQSCTPLCSTLLVSFINLNPVCSTKESSCWMLLVPWQSWISFHACVLHLLLSCNLNRWNISHYSVFFFKSQFVLRVVALRFSLLYFFPHSFPLCSIFQFRLVYHSCLVAPFVS